MSVFIHLYFATGFLFSFREFHLGKTTEIELYESSATVQQKLFCLFLREAVVITARIRNMTGR